ncbi:MAG: hypothetical protein R8N23_18080 [Reichenbachiella sp.]|uniref:hypothetical protein n=1 Tax=Reichenbachiella sp. TaxID=2184521 RepID=UPI002966EA00|nr:hypothetical protein [Reichenbachiella sp.]MDW3211783.1 hypothetical protein [Reichenbachiella sp.]
MQLSFIEIKNPIAKQLGYTLLFGVLSALFGSVRMLLPGIEGAGSDFREIPLLVSLFYLQHPIYIVLISLITSLVTPPNAMINTFVMHLVALLIGFYAYKKIKTYHFNHFVLGTVWVVFTIVYYYLFLIPMFVVVNELLGRNQEIGIINSYKSITSTMLFELTSTALVSSIFLIQLEMRRSLEDHKKNLVIMVNKKTKALADANDELKSMNENLDSLVKERTQKVQDQYEQMLKYAYLNSHEVRAPLSRMQGLMSIIIQEQDIQSKMELIEKLKLSSEELDAIIIEMSQILESELIKGKKVK